MRAGSLSIVLGDGRRSKTSFLGGIHRGKDTLLEGVLGSTSRLKEHGLLSCDLPFLSKGIGLGEFGLSVTAKQLSCLVVSHHAQTGSKVVVGGIEGLDGHQVLERGDDNVLGGSSFDGEGSLLLVLLNTFNGIEIRKLGSLKVSRFDTVEPIFSKGSNLQDIVADLDRGAFNVGVLLATSSSAKSDGARMRQC